MARPNPKAREERERKKMKVGLGLLFGLFHTDPARADTTTANELFEALGAMEKFGVSVVKRAQEKRDRSEMMARLQRANHNQRLRGLRRRLAFEHGCLYCV